MNRPRFTPPRGATSRLARSRRPQADEHDLVGAMVRYLEQQNRRGNTPSGMKAMTPDKCSYEMSQGAYRKWRRSMKDWFELSKVSPADAVLSIRLNCDDQLQRALDAMYTAVEWRTLSIDNALDAVQDVTQKTMNRAVLWDKFFSAQQGPFETAKAYVHRCQQQALDCAFRCPHCQTDLSDYMLTHRLASGISNAGLKREILQDYDKYCSVAKILQKCEVYEAAERDSGKEKLREATAASVIEETRLSCDSLKDSCEVAAVKSNFRRQKESVRERTNVPQGKCYNCGRNHAKGRGNCPASDQCCHICGIKGHFARCCRKKSGNGSQIAPICDAVTSCTLLEPPAVLQVTAVSGKMPVVRVKLNHGLCNSDFYIDAVADTGAQVCIMGERVLEQLSVRQCQINKTNARVNHAAEGPMQVMGSLRCTITLGQCTAVEEVLVIRGAARLYLSLRMCKHLSLVDQNFPYHATLAVNKLDSSEHEHDHCQRYDDPPAAQLPYTPTECNVPRLKQWMLQRFSSTVFNTQKFPLPIMAGKPHRIHLSPEAVPYVCHTPIPIPKHWEGEVKSQLDEDVKLGVIRPVPAGTVTDWCTRMVVVPKKNGKPRRTVDYQQLNKYCKRETHHTFAPFDMVSSVPFRTFKTVVDAYSGFHQVELDEASRHLTTFITPWGRYQYCRTPMGHCSASDAYTKRFDDVIVDVKRKFKCVDDILLYDDSVEGSFLHAMDLLQRCEMNGVTLHPDKFKFCQREVDFVGYELGWDSYKPADEKMIAIKNFPMPEKPSITDIRSWFGLVNQLAPFIATTPVMDPFRDLLKKSPHKRVYWDAMLQAKFVQAKESICKMIGEGLAYYDKSRRTAVVTDWCREGMAFVVLQQHCACDEANAPFCCKGGWKLALCGSRHLSDAETSYAVVEGEAAAIVWCLQKARLFLLGCPNITIVTDHRPLIKLFGDRELKDIANPRLLRLKEKTLQYRFIMKYIPGKQNSAADTLSRYPVLKAPLSNKEEEEEEERRCVSVAALMTSMNNDVITLDWESVGRAAEADVEYELLKNTVINGSWPASRTLIDSCLKPYFGIRDRLSMVEDLVVYTYDEGHIRLVIPLSLRERVVDNLHAGHQSPDSMIRRARQAVYWPGMEGQLKQRRRQCHTCDVIAPSQQREPLMLTPPPEYPFQHTVVDMFQVNGRQYMVYADRLTGWLEIAFFANGTSSAKLVPVFRQYFTQWGAPEEISLDGGTNLISAEIADFFRVWGVKMRISSAHYPQSNGRAEAAVRTAKRTIQDNTLGNGSLDCDKVAKAILQYRNTPLRGIDKSPAQLAMGRQLRDSVPMMKSYHKITEQWSDVIMERERKMSENLSKTKMKLDEHAHALPLLFSGDRVALQNVVSKAWDRSGQVVERKGNRQYTIKLDGSGRLSIRNRKHLRQVWYGDSLHNGATGDRGHGDSRTQSIQSTPDSTPSPRRGTRRKQPPPWHKDYVLDEDS